MTTTNDIMAIEGKFFASLGNGVAAGEHLFSMVESVVSSRDTTVLTKAIKRADINKSDKLAGNVIRFVVSQVWPGAKMTKNKADDYSIKIKGIEADTAALSRFKSAIEHKLSIRHAAFRKHIKPDTGETAAREPIAVVKSGIKAAKKNGMTREQYIAMCEAVWNDVTAD